MDKGEFNIRRRLSHIYKADQCTDLNDVEIAQKALACMARQCGEWTPAMRRRSASLEAKFKKLASIIITEK